MTTIQIPTSTLTDHVEEFSAITITDFSWYGKNSTPDANFNIEVTESLAFETNEYVHIDDHYAVTEALYADKNNLIKANVELVDTNELLSEHNAWLHDQHKSLHRELAALRKQKSSLLSRFF